MIDRLAGKIERARGTTRPLILPQQKAMDLSCTLAGMRIFSPFSRKSLDRLSPVAQKQKIILVLPVDLPSPVQVQLPVVHLSGAGLFNFLSRSIEPRTVSFSSSTLLSKDSVWIGTGLLCKLGLKTNHTFRLLIGSSRADQHANGSAWGTKKRRKTCPARHTAPIPDSICMQHLPKLFSIVSLHASASWVGWW